ncbi:Zn finger protein HypA/HybF involved in hydrogenase expression [Bradyrhizobium japonicum]
MPRLKRSGSALLSLQCWTVAEGAALNIVELPGVAWCMSCSKSVEIARRGDCCPCCGSYQLQVTAGEQMRVKALEID